ncbi:MAG: HPr family phosphocarrier protein [Elusimicrobia bacterium]|nr:HPr family phosphocarrier protein [Elusimicrobiota bacterium]
MREKTFTINNKLGLHARPAALLAQTACRHKASVKIFKGDVEVNGKSVMGLMMLAAGQGTRVRVVIDGEDEQQSMEAIEKLFSRKFDED